MIDASTDAIYAVAETGRGGADDDTQRMRLDDTVIDGEIIMEDTETGIVIVLDLSQMHPTVRPTGSGRGEAPYTWDENIGIDVILDGFFADNVAD